MELFRNATEMQRFVTIDSTLELQSLEPFEEEVKQQVLFDWLGEEQYNDLKDNFNDLTVEQSVLLPFVQRVMACFCMVHHLSIPVQIGNSGAYRVESENQKSVYKYQNAQSIQKYTELGWNAVERMLSFLNQWQSNYPLWANSEAKANSRALMINSYKEFKRVYHVVHGRWVFEGLRPIMTDVELFLLVPLIGQSYYDTLRVEIVTGNISDANKKALQFIQKAIAYLTIEQAIQQKKGVLRNNSFVFVEDSGDDNMQQVRMAIGSAAKKLNAHTMGNRYLSYVKQFLIENLSDYPDFATHHNAKVEAQAAKPVIEPKDRKIVVL